MFVESVKASWDLGATVPVGLCEIMDKAESTQVHCPSSSKPKATKWLEMRMDKGMSGPDGQVPWMPGQQVSVCMLWATPQRL